MKKKRLTEQQIAFTLRQAEQGAAVEEITRKLEVSEATFYRWKKKFSGMGVAELHAADERWCMDFTWDQLASGHRIRVLTIVEIFSRESLALYVGQSIKGYDVVAVLDRLLKRRGKRTGRAFIESFNGTLGAQGLNQNWFLSLADTRDKVEAWRQDYSRSRPNSSLDNLTPQEFALRGIPPASATPRPPEYHKAT
jgi:putative transposase